MLNGSPVILYEEAVDLTSVDYEDANGEGFYFHCTGAGNIAYIPFKNEDDAVITKSFDATDSYTRAILARKIIKSTTTATGIFAGKG